MTGPIRISVTDAEGDPVEDPATRQRAHMTEPVKMAEDWWSGECRKRAELNARYKAIDQAWRNSGMPAHVLQTPDWRDGWRALVDWLALYDPRASDPERWASLRNDYWPRFDDTWANEIHILSHSHNPRQGHHAQHAAIEEQGTRAVLGWWVSRVPDRV